MIAMKPRIFHSDLTENYYYASRVKDLGNGKFEIVGRKIDVTADVKLFIMQALEAQRLDWHKRGLLKP